MSNPSHLPEHDASADGAPHDPADEAAANFNFDDDDDFDDAPNIRAKWSMDGATTLAEAAALLRGFAAYLDQQAAEGWELRETIRDDYGFLEKRDEAASPGHSK